MYQKIKSLISDKFPSIGLLLIVVYLYIDYIATGSFNLGAFLLGSTIWLILAILLSKNNIVAKELYRTIDERDWNRLWVYIYSGFILKNSVIRSDIYWSVIFSNLVYFLYYVLEPLYTTLGVDIARLNQATDVILGLTLVNMAVKVITEILVGTLQNVEKIITKTEYDGTKY